MRVASKNNPTANGHCLLCLYCCMVYLACSSGLNLISTNWGISSSIAAPPLPQWLILEEPEKRLGKKNGQGGKWGGTQTGSGCNFLRKLSEPFPVWPIRCEEREEARQKRDENEWDILKRKKKVGAHKCFRMKHGCQNWIKQTSGPAHLLVHMGTR